MITIIEAIKSLNSNACVAVGNNDLDDIRWLDGTSSISKEKIQAEVIRLQAEYDAQEYARNRQAEYPDWGTQLNKIYDDGLTKWKSEMVDPVKAKWPKDNSGPV